MVAKLARIGIVPGQDFDPAQFDPAVRNGLRKAPRAALERIMGHFNSAGVEVNGWRVLLKTGGYGTNYLQRAFVTAIGLGANRPQDAVYPTSLADAAGKPYNGSNKYVIHFDKGQLPPVNAFWSLTLYDPEFFFVPNPLNRFTLSERNKLTANADGSVDLYVQKESPGKDKESNWLPAPDGRFVLMLRLYWPKENDPPTMNLGLTDVVPTPWWFRRPQEPSILDGSWKPPPVKQVEK
jgi:hypothetical protein